MFLKLETRRKEEFLVNTDNISYITKMKDGSCIVMIGGESICVLEEYETLVLLLCESKK